MEAITLLEKDNMDGVVDIWCNLAAQSSVQAARAQDAGVERLRTAELCRSLPRHRTLHRPWRHRQSISRAEISLKLSLSPLEEN